ncbi:hypothetical protein GGQ92_001379 [Gracilibacillus halotolerans]|uniref:Uncharacterized protein n=1 Tax=Gracilibacillus halotolerans TaxID=74386 RepID=A0A841RLU8_9BACI|nr:hypothetical protein [Gracilibacillus halotolerans]
MSFSYLRGGSCSSLLKEVLLTVITIPLVNHFDNNIAHYFTKVSQFYFILEIINFNTIKVCVKEGRMYEAFILHISTFRFYTKYYGTNEIHTNLFFRSFIISFNLSSCSFSLL